MARETTEVADGSAMCSLTTVQCGATQQKYSAPYYCFTLGGSEVIWSASVSRYLVLRSTEP